MKPLQFYVAKEFVCGKDVFVSLSTGSGKSLCYAILPAVFDILHQHEQPTTTVIVVSPLRALMKDQVDTFTKKGIKAVRISSVEEEVKHAIMDGAYQLIYTSPKTLLTDLDWRDILLSPLFQHSLEVLVIASCTLC